MYAESSGKWLPFVPSSTAFVVVRPSLVGWGKNKTLPPLSHHSRDYALKLALNSIYRVHIYRIKEIRKLAHARLEKTKRFKHHLKLLNSGIRLIATWKKTKQDGGGSSISKCLFA